MATSLSVDEWETAVGNFGMASFFFFYVSGAKGCLWRYEGEWEGAGDERTLWKLDQRWTW